MTPKMMAAAALAALVPAAAMALAVGDALGTDVEEIRAKLEAEGYNVVEIEVEGNEIEVDYMVDGQEYELEVDATTGMVLEIERDDDDD